MPAITNAAIAMVLITLGSWPFITVISIFPSELIKHTTPKETIATKYRTITEMTRQPPQALIKKSSNNERIRVKKIIESEIGQVAFKSEID